MIESINDFLLRETIRHQIELQRYEAGVVARMIAVLDRADKRIAAELAVALQEIDPSLFKDFAAATLTDASAQIVLSMNMQGLITKETALKEMQRRAVLSADLDVKTEVGLAEDDAPDLGAKTSE